MKERHDTVYIISELSPQYDGSFEMLKTMSLQSKIGGADAVKVQLYNSLKLHGNNEKSFMEINFNELKELKTYCDSISIALIASVFDEERLQWCEELDFKKYKVASRTVQDKVLCNKIFNTKKQVFMSLGMVDWKNLGLPYKYSNLIYFDCIAQYPTLYSDLKIADFRKNKLLGFSDHTIGISACLYAVSKGAKILEKHFSNSKAMNVETQQGHTGSMNMNDLFMIRELSDNLRLSIS